MHNALAHVWPAATKLERDSVSHYWHPRAHRMNARLSRSEAAVVNFVRDRARDRPEAERPALVRLANHLERPRKWDW